MGDSGFGWLGRVSDGGDSGGSHGTCVLAGLAYPACSDCGWRAVGAIDGEAVFGECEQRRQMGSTLARNRQCCTEPGSGSSSAGAGRTRGLDTESDRGETGSDAGRNPRRAWQAGDQCQHWHDLELLRPPQYQLQKKACMPANRTAPTSPWRAPPGKITRAGLIQNVWCSWMKPAPVPT